MGGGILDGGGMETLNVLIGSYTHTYVRTHNEMTANTSDLSS